MFVKHLIVQTDLLTKFTISAVYSGQYEDLNFEEDNKQVNKQTNTPTNK